MYIFSHGLWACYWNKLNWIELSLPFCLLRLYTEGIDLFSTHDLTNFSVFVGCCSSSFCFHPPCPKPLDWIGVQCSWFSLTFSKSTFQTIPVVMSTFLNVHVPAAYNTVHRIRVFTILFFNSNSTYPLSNFPRLLNDSVPVHWTNFLPGARSFRTLRRIFIERAILSLGGRHFHKGCSFISTNLSPMRRIPPGRDRPNILWHWPIVTQASCTNLVKWCATLYHTFCVIGLFPADDTLSETNKRLISEYSDFDASVYVVSFTYKTLYNRPLPGWLLIFWLSTLPTLFHSRLKTYLFNKSFPP